MVERISIEHATFGLLGPLSHTPTRTMSVHCVIILIGDRVILVDTGFGTREMLEPNRYLGSDALLSLGIVVDVRLTALHRLAARGIRAEQVTDIVLTHLDADHAGGLHDFPGATVHLSAEELAAYDEPQSRGSYHPYQVSRQTNLTTYGPTDEQWFGLPARSLPLPQGLDAKLIPLPGHSKGHCGVAYRENGQWTLHAGDAYFDARVNFLDTPPGLPLEIAMQADPCERVASLSKLRELRSRYGSEIAMFCAHDHQEYTGWTEGRGRTDPVDVFGRNLPQSST
ncbi:MBL fold metallo-hydrolase [Methylobacterium nonmethylotrophicum]|uniref:MBL fold metallo-hydrolase n=1 Tax=Methylobacterium nonmethylotrophicum TaxID=1141884 RepID=A0A4Z0NRY0_9HYPH|nr:MBL fold metallo-hydrolase [Methylobacterium nonmethylotrophicum]TGD99670.1 MBL fold metallo-hydrolase [Methylobacterium nonmethylotrophicum]